jgi:SNARE protein 1
MAIRKQLIQGEVSADIRDTLRQYANIIELSKIPNILIMENTVKQDKKSRLRRMSVDIHNAGLEEIDPTTGATALDDDNLFQLKQRLTQGRRKEKKPVSMDEQLHAEESKQDDILNDMLQFVQGIKEGANAFNDKLNQEQDILKAAEAGLQVTQKKINKSSKDLAKTINELSLFTALKIFAVLVGLFFSSILVIMVLPKL